MALNDADRSDETQIVRSQGELGRNATRFDAACAPRNTGQPPSRGFALWL